MLDKRIQIALSIALIVSVFSVGYQISVASYELTRTRATLERAVYGAVQNDPEY